MNTMIKTQNAINEFVDTLKNNTDMTIRLQAIIILSNKIGMPYAIQIACMFGLKQELHI